MSIPVAGVSFAPTSGSSTFTAIQSLPTINQTGGANGITRGIHVNPTLTAAADWRSIEWSNNSGWGLYGAGTSNNYLGGRLGLGSTTLTAINLNVDLNISGAVQSVAIQQNGIVQSGVTSAAFGIFNGARLQSTAFTLTNYYHYWTQQSTLSGGSAITNQYGYWVDSTLIGATNNYGFYGNIASATGRWNLYMNGTANNYMAGRLAIGTTSTTANLTVFSSIVDAPSGTNKGAFQLAFSTTNGLSFGTYSTSPFANYIQSISATQGNSGVYPLSLQPNGGAVLIGASTSSGEALQVTGTAKITGATTFSSTVTSTQFRLSALNTAPATASSTGTLGEIRIDADYIYICTATNTWKRVAIATW
jgi:hypothetical protein